MSINVQNQDTVVLPHLKARVRQDFQVVGNRWQFSKQIRSLNTLAVEMEATVSQVSNILNGKCICPDWFLPKFFEAISLQETAQQEYYVAVWLDRCLAVGVDVPQLVAAVNGGSYSIDV